MSKKKYKLDELPVYEIIIDDEQDTGIRYLSIVQDPAIETKGMYFSDVEIKEFRFYVNRDQQKIVGPALIPYKKIYRSDDDGEYFVMFTPETIEKMVRKFNATGNNRRVNFDHSNQIVDGFIEQNWLIEDDVYDKSKIYGYDLPKKTWFVEVKIEDSVFWNEMVKENGFCSFSIEGLLGQRLVSMASHMDFFIDNLTEAEIMELYHEFADSYTPTEEMKQSALLGLKWRKEYNRGGTEVGVARARDISNGRNLSEDTVKRMYSYFSRHEVDKKASGFEQGEDGFLSAGRIAWELWGGDAGQRFSTRIVERLKQI